MTTALADHRRPAIGAMYAGLALTVGATVVPHIDHATANVLADHIRAVKAGRRWARAAAPAMFALGAGIGLLDLIIKDTSGDTGLPPLLGWVGMLPSVAGLLAVTLLWRRS
jgi:hypothetical protein